MPDLLLELFSEEIPARMQGAAAKDLERLVVGALSDRGLMFEGVKAFAGPRRLTLAISGLPDKQPGTSEEKKGPRINAPEKAIEGFLRSAGVTLDQCQKQNDGKGEFYVAVISRKGSATADVLAEILPEAFAKLPWPKSMRFPAGRAQRWVRPLHSILCTFDGEVVPFEFAGVKSGNITRGHRFLSSGAIEARHFEDYEKKLRDAHVIVDAAERKDIILHEARQKAFALGLELIEDVGLLDEVAGLAEWPVVLIGKIEDQFMDVPAEILQTSMRTHQKYFALRDPKTGGLANRFALVSNMVTADGGAEIVAGNERVLRARLSDAKFFWDQDRKRTLESRVDDLKNIVFHAKLGTQYERVERIEALAGEIAAKIGADVAKAKRAARLCKADLTTGVVGEFPELQGVMGRYYALHDGEDAQVADAIRDHYKPLGPRDAIPAGNLSMAVALADKLDTLVGFFLIEEMPTGSGDPFGLRRAALGVIRIILSNGVRLELPRLIVGVGRPLMAAQLGTVRQQMVQKLPLWEELKDDNLFRQLLDVSGKATQALARAGFSGVPAQEAEIKRTLKVLNFLSDRLVVVLKERGISHDRIDAIWNITVETDLVRLVTRVEALQSFLKTDDGANLLAGYKRAANILKIEAKKDGKAFDGAADAALLSEPAEKSLAKALDEAKAAISPALEREDFAGAMTAMAGLRAPVDAFFDKVKVNADDPEIRENRLKLLSQIVATAHSVADFSKIEG